MDRGHRGVALVVALLVAVVATSGCATLVEISDRSGGNPADFGFVPFDNGGPTVSRDGRYAVFLGATSPSDAPTAFGPSTSYQAYRRDNRTGAVDLVSRFADGSTAFASSVAISGTGRYVAFVTSAALVAVDTNGGNDVYVRDMDTGTTTRESLMPNGAQFGSGLQNGIIDRTVFISDDGHTLAFANRFNEGDVVVYVRRVVKRTTKLVDRANVRLGGISGDGLHVAVVSTPYCIGTSLCYAAGPALELDWQHGTSTQLGTCDASVPVGLSYDGRYAAVALNGIGDPACAGAVWRFDRLGGPPTLASRDATRAPHEGFEPSISQDGSRVTFTSRDALVVADTNGRADVYVADVTGGTVDIASVTGVGDPASGASRLPWITGDGRYVAFTTDATNLTGGQGEQQPDVVMTAAVRPRVTSVRPDREPRGSTTSVTIVGTGFAPDASVYVSGPGVSIGALQHVGTTTVVATVTVAADAPVGRRDLGVLNPGPFGTSAAPCLGCVAVT